MLEEFSKRKCEEYLKQIEFKNDGVYFENIQRSNLPPYIINFFYHSFTDKQAALKKEELEKLLKNAIAFNINYVIKPKATLLKFLFGSTDARPTEYIIERLSYFQFYRYYINAITEFIQVNSLSVISLEQTEKLIDEINNKLFEEISNEESSDAQRLNLVKLLYHFFIDLAENNPINIKLPKGILSEFFHDKGFYDIQQRTDDFFKEDIFIQEAIELIKKKPEKAKVENFEQKQILPSPEEIRLEEEQSKTFEEKSPDAEPVSEAKENTTYGNLYSEELISAVSNQEGQTEHYSNTESENERKEKTYERLFCEANYRKKIVKKLFGKDENLFKEFVFKLLDINNWDTAAEFIDNYFTMNNFDYCSEEAVKFVDIMEEYFEDASPPPPLQRRGG